MNAANVAVAEEFLDTSCRALGADGAAGLDTLGWWDLLDELDDPFARQAMFAAFRAQGRTLCQTAALGALVAQPWGELVGFEPGSVVAALGRRSPRRGLIFEVIGDAAGRDVLVDIPDSGVFVIDGAKVDVKPIDVPGNLGAGELNVEVELLGDARVGTASNGTTAAGDIDAIRETSAFLGRVATSYEILGAAEALVALAVTYASDREQFGSPIGKFQAVRHLLAWAATDCVAIELATTNAIELADAPPQGFGEHLKALAGRNGRKAAERALQTFGGVGFTAEHEHHRFHSRILQLDALLGTSAELTARIGADIRGGADPGFATALLNSPSS